ncbi:hypothetical protein D3C87_1896040 [compost metagenome]
MQLQLAEEVVDPPEQYRVGSIDLQIAEILEDHFIQPRGNQQELGIRVAFAQDLDKQIITEIKFSVCVDHHFFLHILISFLLITALSFCLNCSQLRSR